jgi:DNA-binding transcriptional LysR family regulator
VPTLAFEDLPDTVARVPLAEPLERAIGVAVLPSSLKVPAVRAFLGVLKARFPESALPHFRLTKPLQNTLTTTEA